MNCKYCNEPMNVGAKFCIKCGKPVQQVKEGTLPSMRRRNVITCSNGHFYDAAEYSVCPHCDKLGLQISASVNSMADANKNPINTTANNFKKKKAKKSLFSFGRKKDAPVQSSSEYNTNEAAVNKGNINQTVALMNLLNDEEEETYIEEKQSMPLNAKRAVMRHGTVNKAVISSAVDVSPLNDEAERNEEKIPSSLLRNEYEFPVQKPVVSEAKPADVIREYPKREESSKTVAIYSDLSNDEPVVGWLVCVKGTSFGQSFNLIAGKNTIGRSLQMDVDLVSEESVSRNTHAIIIYEPKKRQFILKAGDSSGLTYLNDELVLDHLIIKAYDKIQLGECEMIFVPFCNEKFTWDIYKGQE